MKELAYAKLNLYLHIEGKTENGYHLLNSLMCFVNLYDEIDAELAEEITVLGGGDIPQEDNLIYKVAVRLQEYVYNTHQQKVGATITLTKNLPVGAGIGGGSADAAATLRLLPKLWDIPVPYEVIHRIASELGSDIVACVHSKPVIATGTGNDITPIDVDLKKYTFVLVNPLEEVSTKDVYEKYAEMHLKPFCEDEICVSAERITPEHFKPHGDEMQILRNAHNALQPPAVSILPKIANVLEDLEHQDGCKLARMSGSGATCFAVFTNKRIAENTARLMHKKYGWAVVAKAV